MGEKLPLETAIARRIVKRVSKLHRACLITASAMTLSGCVSVESGAPLLVVSMKRDGGGCRATVDGARVSSEQLFSVARHDAHRRGIVLYDRGTPYKCVGGAIFTLQKAGLVYVDAAMWDGG